MARVDPDALAHRELSQIFIAGALTEARRAEEVLTAEGVDYVVKVEPFLASVFFGPRNGAVFYVTASQAAHCRSCLMASGLDRGVVEEED